MVFYNENKSMIISSYILSPMDQANWCNCKWEQESANVYKVTFADGFPAGYKYVRFGIPVADGANAYVTYDAAMPNA